MKPSADQAGSFPLGRWPIVGRFNVIAVDCIRSKWSNPFVCGLRYASRADRIGFYRPSILPFRPVGLSGPDAVAIAYRSHQGLLKRPCGAPLPGLFAGVWLLMAHYGPVSFACLAWQACRFDQEQFPARCRDLCFPGGLTLPSLPGDCLHSDKRCSLSGG